MRNLFSMAMIVAIFAGIAGLQGCNSRGGRNVETGSLTVVVVSGEKPVINAAVRLLATSGEFGTIGDLDSNGKVAFEKVEVGEYRVAIFPAVSGHPNPEAPATQMAKPADIPKKFQDEINTPLRATVTKSGGEVRFDLLAK